MKIPPESGREKHSCDHPVMNPHIPSKVRTAPDAFFFPVMKCLNSIKKIKTGSMGYK